MNNVKADTQELIVNEERIDVENLVTTSDTSMGEQLTDVRLRIMEERRDIVSTIMSNMNMVNILLPALY